MIRLREYQQQALDARSTAGKERPEENRQAIVMATGLGKGHPLETEVPTPRGWRRWGDLEVGDSVFARDGRPTKVLEVHDRGELPTYVVTLSDSSTVTVDGDHLWTVRDSSDSRRPWVTLETRALAALDLKRSRGWRFHVPMALPLERGHLELPLDPYVVGALIANGSMVSTGTQLTTPDLEVAARIEKATTCNKINDATEGVCDRYSLPGLVSVTRGLGMRVRSSEKRIPSSYLETSIQQRIDLLHGLMDGDGGGRDASRRSVSYFTSSPGLALDVLELVTSLGGTASSTMYDRGVRGVEYAVRILLPSSVPAFSSSRKGGAGASSVRNLQPRRAIVSVVRSSTAPIRCIRVVARDHLYLITRDHIVTHNTITFGAEAAAEPGRSLILVHTDELAQQAEAKVKLMAPGRTVGVVKAERDDVHAEIIVGSVQTLAQPGRSGVVGDMDRLIVDECHHAVSPTYRHIIGQFPESPVTGYTATLERGDGQSLGQVWHDVAFSRDISWAVRKGFLVPPVGYTVTIPELAYAASDTAMDNALVDSIAPERVVDAWLEHGQGRSTVLFAPLVRSARAFCAAFNDRGVQAAVIHGAMPKEERRARLAAYDRGDIQVLCNAMVLTEGWDSPRTKCVIVARPTKSRPLFIQMAGRGLRRWPEGEHTDCVLLCVADSTTELRSIADLSDRPGLEAEDGKSLTALEDEYDLSQDLEPDPEHAYAGAVDVTQFDPLVARSSKVWTKTKGGALFIPARKGEFIFLAPDTDGLAIAHVDRAGGRRVHRHVPDTELAMALAEDFAQDHGGDIGRLLADKGRAWRKGVPSEAAREEALRLGLDKELARIMASRSAGKAGKLSDLLSTTKASRVIDPVVSKIRERMSYS